MTRHLFIRWGMAILSALASTHNAWSTTSAIQIHFNQRAETSFIEPYRGTLRLGENFEKIIVREIDQAGQSVDLAATALTLPHIAQSLSRARQRGVQVRVIMDNTYHQDWAALEPDEVASLDGDAQTLWAEIENLIDTDQDGEHSEVELLTNDVSTLFRQHGIPVVDDTADGSKGSGTMHHKFVAIDGMRVIVSSANFTHSGFFGDIGTHASRGNVENLQVLNSSDLTALYRQEFDVMWGDGPGATTNSLFGVKKPHRPPRQIAVSNAIVTVQFGPTSARRTFVESSAGTVTQFLQRANQSIQIAMYVLTDQMVTDVLREAFARPGLHLEALFDRSFASNDYNASLDMWGLEQWDATCQLKLHARPWPLSPQMVGVPNLPEGDKLHHKFAIIDGQIVLTGSYNWTTSGLRDNDENLLVIHDVASATQYAAEMSRLKQSAMYGPSPNLLRRIRTDGERCGH